MKLAEKYGEKKDICNAIGAHHDEIEMTTMISPVVQICDAVPVLDQVQDGKW